MLQLNITKKKLTKTNKINASIKYYRKKKKKKKIFIKKKKKKQKKKKKKKKGINLNEKYSNQ